MAVGTPGTGQIIRRLVLEVSLLDAVSFISGVSYAFIARWFCEANRESAVEKLKGRIHSILFYVNRKE